MSTRRTAADMLALEARGGDVYRAANNLDSGVGAIFGGQPLVQGLAAATATVPDWPAHHLSALFLRSGNVAAPVDYAVDRTRDGRRFASRRVVASQNGKPIFDMLCSFHDPEEGPAHEVGTFDPPPAPETLQSLAEFGRANADRLPEMMAAIYSQDFPIELRLPDPEAIFFGTDNPPERAYWIRVPTAGGIADPRAQQCLLALMSDYWFASTAAAPHSKPGDGGRNAVVTLNHGLWFHAPVRTDDWLLYRTESSWAGEGRGFQRGMIYDRRMRLIASTTQETSMRPRAQPGRG